MSIEKDPLDEIYYTIDLNDWLNDSELVTSLSITCPTVGVILDSQIGVDSKSVTAKIGGGTHTESLIITYDWQTNLTRRKVKRLVLPVKKAYIPS